MKYWREYWYKKWIVDMLSIEKYILEAIFDKGI